MSNAVMPSMITSATCLAANFIGPAGVDFLVLQTLNVAEDALGRPLTKGRP